MTYNKNDTLLIHIGYENETNEKNKRMNENIEKCAILRDKREREKERERERDVYFQNKLNRGYISRET